MPSLHTTDFGDTIAVPLSGCTVFHKVAPELWCQIMEYFHPEDQRDDLLSCSLAFRELVYPSQCMLFSTLLLPTHDSVGPILDKLSNAPHFARCVRYLNIEDMDSGQTWSGNTQGLGKLLALCTGIVQLSIRIRGCVVIRDAAKDNGTCVERRRCETGLLFHPLSSVHTICIEETTNMKYTALPQFLNGFANLQKLLVSFWFTPRARQSLLPGYEKFQPTFSLQTLILSFNIDIPFLEWLSPALKRLTHLRISRTAAFDHECDNDLEAFHHWLHKSGRSITHLTLDLPSHYKGINQFLPLIQFIPLIETLTVTGLMMDGRSNIRIALDLLGQFKLTRLRRLNLVFSIPTNSEPDPMLLENLCYHIHTALLNNKPAYSNVRLDLHFQFTATEDIDYIPLDYRDMYHTIEERVSSLLHLLSSRNMLHLSRSFSNLGERWDSL